MTRLTKPETPEGPSAQMRAAERYVKNAPAGLRALLQDALRLAEATRRRRIDVLRRHPKSKFSKAELERMTDAQLRKLMLLADEGAALANDGAGFADEPRSIAEARRARQRDRKERGLH